MDIFLLTALPFSVILFFILHWFSIREIGTAQERLSVSRITYLGLSLQLLVFSVFPGFFLLSDAAMGETTVHGGRHPVLEFQVPWITYLIAQSLLIIGFYLEMEV